MSSMHALTRVPNPRPVPQGLAHAKATFMHAARPWRTHPSTPFTRTHTHTQASVASFLPSTRPDFTHTHTPHPTCMSAEILNIAARGTYTLKDRVVGVWCCVGGAASVSLSSFHQPPESLR